jgi:hypothetical protein
LFLGTTTKTLTPAKWLELSNTSAKLSNLFQKKYKSAVFNGGFFYALQMQVFVVKYLAL